MQDIPRGLTQKGVNREVFKSLSANIDFSTPREILDIPCGEGVFAAFLKQKFPNLKITGVDLRTGAKDKDIIFHNLKAQDYLSTYQPKNLDAILCVSGVMCFDGLPDLFSSFHSALKPGGILIITNDNILTIRDRLNFLFFGHLKRFKLLFDKNEGNWNLVLPQALFMFLERNGFRKISVKYTATYNEDLIFVPLALIVYPLFLISLLLRKSPISVKDRMQLFPFGMFYNRHYVITAQK